MWCHPKPKLLYLLWEKWRQVRTNELGRMPGLGQLWSWQLRVFTNRRERRGFQSEVLPEEAEGSEPPSPDQRPAEQQTTSKH